MLFRRARRSPRRRKFTRPDPGVPGVVGGTVPGVGRLSLSGPALEVAPGGVGLDAVEEVVLLPVAPPGELGVTVPADCPAPPDDVADPFPDPLVVPENEFCEFDPMPLPGSPAPGRELPMPLPDAPTPSFPLAVPPVPPEAPAPDMPPPPPAPPPVDDIPPDPPPAEFPPAPELFELPLP